MSWVHYFGRTKKPKAKVPENSGQKCMVYIVSEYLNRQGMVRNIYFRIYRLTMHGYVVETCFGEENCPLLMSKVRRVGKELFLFVNLQVRALVIQSLRADPSGLTPDDPLVRTRLLSTLTTLVGKGLFGFGPRVWVAPCGDNWPLCSALFNIRYWQSSH